MSLERKFMMILNDEKLLRRECYDVDINEIDSLISILEKELYGMTVSGISAIGLAAPQINILKKAAIVRLKGDSINLINAEIREGYDLQLFKNEGCLSFPNKLINTMRYQEIIVVNNLVEPHSFQATGLMAVAIQHELDHLNQKLFMDSEVKVKQLISNKIGPNELCPCGSKLKYKRCCRK